MMFLLCHGSSVKTPQSLENKMENDNPMKTIVNEAMRNLILNSYLAW